MRVLLVGPDFEANLSLQYLAASLRAAGHMPRIAAFNTASDAASVLEKARDSDLVGLSMCFQVRALDFLDLAAALKREEPRRPVIAGGHYASCAATELLANHPALDLIVVHEGERTIVELADLGAELLDRAAQVPGVVLRRDGRPWFSPPRPILEDLEHLPRPDRSGPARLLCGVPTAYLMGSRGCVSACDYCCITTLHRMARGPRFRQRSPEDVAGEMSELYHARGVRQFVFHDDNFLVPSYEHNRQRIGRIGAALEQRRVRDIGLVLKCSPRDADRRILETLRDMGLLRLFMGIESGSACGLASIGRRQTVEQSERAVELCEQLGISTQYTMIIFSPEATAASMLADLAFIDRHPAHPLNYCRAEIYAGTPLEARMIQAGRAIGSYLGRVYRYTDPKVELVWEMGRDLFAGRCWGKDELLGSVIRMDHQVAVLKHFYEGRRVRQLARSFAAWETELNLETSGFFRELVVACAEATGSADPKLAVALADLRLREGRSRELRLGQICEFRKALERFTQVSVESGRRYALGLPQGRRFRPPRHAAAVAVAIGMLGCRGAATDDALPKRLDEGGPRHDAGIAEAAPPPTELPVAPPQPDASAPAPDAGKPAPVKRRPKREAVAPPIPAPPPTPIDPKGFQIDHGVAEAAPPPLPMLTNVTVSTSPSVPMSLAGQEVEQPFHWALRAGESLLIGSPESPGGISLVVDVASIDQGHASLRVRSRGAPLNVRFGGTRAETPIRVDIRRREAPPAIVVENPKTHARLTVRIVPPVDDWPFRE